MNIIIDTIAIFFPIVIFIIFGVLNKSKIKWVNQINDSNFIFWILISWIIFGFFAKLDYTNQWGCFAIHEPVFSRENILFSSISLFLLFLGVYLIPKKLGYVILIFEVFIWLFKLFLIKGGYIIGVTGGPDIIILWYDFSALILRLLLIKSLFELNLKNIYIFILVILIMILKIGI